MNGSKREATNLPQDWGVFYSLYADQIQRGQAAVFVGAGLSSGAGLPSWSDLVWTLVKAALPELEPDPDLPLPSVAQYLVNHDSAGRERLHKYLRQELAAQTAPLTEVHHLLPSIGVDLLWTSNYDDLIERAYGEASRPDALDVVVSGADFSRPKSSGKKALFKLHGTLSDDSSIVITRQDYARYRSQNEAMYVALLNDLLRRTFLFIGFSFTDPNVLGVLDDAARLAADRPGRHFAIFHQQDLTKASSRLRIQDLQLLGLDILLVRDWKEVPLHLESLRRQLLRKQVLVSGSARDMPPEAEKRISAFSEKLGRMLIDEGYTIVCGLNPAVGRSLVNGALEALHEKGQQRDVNRRILLWPLPTGHWDNLQERARLREEYRNQMTSNSGVGVFIGGGDGTREEYDALRDKGGRLLPIGAFGGMAADLWQITKFGTDNAAALQRDFQAIGSRQLDDRHLLDALRRLLR